METLLRIRELLTQHFPETHFVFNASNTRRNILMWEVSPDKLFNFDVERAVVLATLEANASFTDCYHFFEQIKVPKHAVDEFRELVLKFSKK